MSSTTKSLLILLGITTVAAGGYVAYTIYKKKKDEECKSDSQAEEIGETNTEEVTLNTTKKLVEQPDTFIFGDEIAKMPEAVEVEKTEYATKAAVYSGDSDEMDVETSKDEEDWESFKVSKEYDDYQKKNKNKIIVLPEGDIEYTWNREVGNDPANPDVCYEEEELYYFTEDETLTDEDGHILDEEQYLGAKPRQFGWFTNNKEDIYIRNNPLERDFRVNKVFAERSAYFD